MFSCLLDSCQFAHSLATLHSWRSACSDAASVLTPTTRITPVLALLAHHAVAQAIGSAASRGKCAGKDALLAVRELPQRARCHLPGVELRGSQGGADREAPCRYAASKGCIPARAGVLALLPAGCRVELRGFHHAIFTFHTTVVAANELAVAPAGGHGSTSEGRPLRRQNTPYANHMPPAADRVWADAAACLGLLPDSSWTSARSHPRRSPAQPGMHVWLCWLPDRRTTRQTMLLVTLYPSTTEFCGRPVRHCRLGVRSRLALAGVCVTALPSGECQHWRRTHLVSVAPIAPAPLIAPGVR